MREYRNEWKYCCTEGELALLSARVKNLLSVDDYALSEDTYGIHSIYFDDYKNTCANDNAMGAERRYKWRIRYYSGPKKSLHLELKHKKFGRTHKESCPLTKKELAFILDRQPEEILWKTKYNLLRKFCYAIMTRNFQPKAIIYYERIAYVDQIANIRITLDKNISASKDFDRFITGDYQKIPIQEGNKQVLEVKFNQILPSYIRDIVNSHGFKQTSFSKYYLGRKKLEELV